MDTRGFRHSGQIDFSFFIISSKHPLHKWCGQTHRSTFRELSSILLYFSKQIQQLPSTFLFTSASLLKCDRLFLLSRRLIKFLLSFLFTGTFPIGLCIQGFPFFSINSLGDSILTYTSVTEIS